MNIFTIMPAWIRIPDRIIVDIRIPIQPLNAGRDNRIRLGEASNGGVVIELRTKKYQPHKLAHERSIRVLQNGHGSGDEIELCGVYHESYYIAAFSKKQPCEFSQGCFFI